MTALIIIGYLLLAAAIVYFSILLSNYVDMLDKSTNISGVLLGGLLLAAVTSLPELFTTMTAVIGVGESSYVLGNILGSDIFDIIILAALFIIFIKNTLKYRINKSHIAQLFCLISCYALVAVATFLPAEIKQYIVLGGWFNIATFGIIAVYVLSLIIMPKKKNGDELSVEKEENKIKLSLKQILIRFSIFTVLLIGCSIGITFLSDLIVQEFHIDTTLAGALLLGVMTSLPELISTINLFIKKNVDAGTGNIIGSCVFNMIIICFGELFSFKNSVFTATPEVNKLIILGLVGVVSCLIAVLFKTGVTNENDRKNKRIFKMIGIVTFSFISFSSYILYLFLPANLFAF